MKSGFLLLLSILLPFSSLAEDSTPKKLILTLKDESGKPVPGVGITASTLVEGRIPQPEKFTSDESGQVSIPLGSDPASNVSVNSASGRWYLKPLLWPFGAQGAVVSEGVARMSLIVYPLSSMGGIVRDPAGAPLAHAQVIAYTLDNPAAPEIRKKLIETKTDAQGHWVLGQVPERAETLLISFRQAGWHTLDVIPTANTSPSIATLFQQMADVRLRPPTPIQGTVTFAGQPVPDAKVSFSFRHARDNFQTSTDRTGHFEILWEEDGSPGMTIIAKDLAPYCMKLNVSAGMKPLAITMGAGHPRKGQVLSGRAGVPGASVVFVGMIGPKLAFIPVEKPVVAVTDSDGRFTWEHAPEFAARYKLLSPDGEELLFEWDTSKNDEKRINIQPGSPDANRIPQ